MTNDPNDAADFDSPPHGPVESVSVGRDLIPGIHLDLSLDHNTEIGRGIIRAANVFNDVINAAKQAAKQAQQGNIKGGIR